MVKIYTHGAGIRGVGDGMHDISHIMNSQRNPSKSIPKLDDRPSLAEAIPGGFL